MGTESRRPSAEFIPPVQEPYQYIIFRASEVKDLAVDEPEPPRRSVHDDPAVLGAAPQAPPQNQNPNTFAPYPNATQPQPQPPPAQRARRPSHEVPTPNNTTRVGAPGNDTNPNGSKSNAISNAAASMETVERALGDLRVGPASGGGRGGGRRGHGRHGEAKEIKVPMTDFDFQGSNAKFDKSAAALRKSSKDGDDEDTNPSEDGTEKEKKAYNPKSSFFDSLSSSTQVTSSTRGGGGGRGGGGRGGAPGGRNRREEERERNVATFGEPGGVGLMGPGAYVGGWGGYSRRGTRPRRGGPPVTTAR